MHVTFCFYLLRLGILLALLLAAPAFAVTSQVAAGYGHTVALKEDGSAEKSVAS